MDVAVVGVGYVGLVTGAVFADLGNDVICVDKVQSKIDMLNKAKMPIYEPGLEELVKRNLDDERLTFTTDIGEAIRKSSVIFIAVGTPPNEEGETDLRHVESVALEIAENLNGYKVIVNKSTVPVGTGDFVRNIIEKNKKDNIDFDVVSNPEFLREGSAINDTLFPERIVIGAPSRNVAMILLELYAPLERPMLITDVNSAEMIKYASNAFLATKISFINAIANICEKCNADVTAIIKGMGYDSRIGKAFLNAGLGYGGSCFPKDSDSLVHTARKYGYEFEILKSVIQENKNRTNYFINRMREVMSTFKGKTISILGLAFKPNTDDLREAKSLELIEILLKEGATLKVYDPVAMDNTKEIYPDLEYCQSSYEAAVDSDALIFVTEWNEFKLLNLEKLYKSMRTPVVFDGRLIHDPARMAKMGFQYYSVGRQPVIGKAQSGNL